MPRRTLFPRGPIGALLATLGLVIAAVRPAHSQGITDYMNVESPQGSPIALLPVGEKIILLACNTPDNSVELWDTDETIPLNQRFIQRIWVGLEPVSVIADPMNGEFFTANFLGDSVTSVKVELDDASGSIRARLLKSENVGDEPLDLALYDDSGSRRLFVSLFSSSAVARLDAVTLLPYTGAAFDPLVQNAGFPPLGIKEPRSVRVFDNRVYALGMKGGVTHPFSMHDLDVLSAPINATLLFNASIPRNPQNPGLGSTNYNMRFSTGGELYSVGGEALNFTSDDKIAVRTQPTGFVISTVYKVTDPSLPTLVVERRDLNRDSAGGIIPKVAPFSPQGRPAAQPTDLALLEDDGGTVQKIYVAAFGSDRIATLTDNGGPLSGWPRTTINLPATTAGGNPRWGPRGMVLGAGASGTRLYVLCRLDNSLVAIDPATDAVLWTTALQNDPTPAYVRDGRHFLYDAERSGDGFVSCASCHTDGRTDALAWRLGNPNNVGPLEPAHSASFIRSIAGTGTESTSFAPPFLGDPDFENVMYQFKTFDPGGLQQGAEDKREMVTQSLQGLLNFEVPLKAKDLVTNAPFHWRGDKPSLREFNEAFVTLLNGNPVAQPPAPPAGLSELEMDQFERFVHSITYPPNPKQPKDRVFSGGQTGGAAGLKLFHTLPTILGERSCAHCHAPSDGSSNRLTVFILSNPLIVPNGFVARPNRQPIESAALRGLFQKEPLLEPDGNFLQSPATTPRIGHFGLNHNGIQQNTAPQTAGGNLTSINTFINLFFPNAVGSADARAIKQFVHEFDWGVAPIVGETVWIDLAVLNDPIRNPEAMAAEARMKTQSGFANAGLVAWLGRPGQSTPAGRFRGFRWHPGLARWIEELSGGVALTYISLTQLVTAAQDSLVLLSIPLGSERRVAGPGGSEPAMPAIVQPAGIDLLLMAPNTAYATIPAIVDQWAPTGAPGADPNATKFFDFRQPNSFFPPPPLPQGTATPVDDVYAKTLRLFQYGLRDVQYPGTQFGVPYLRHEAPRRLRVKGTGILSGAQLVLEIPDPPTGYTGPTPLQWSQGVGGPTFPLRIVELPLYPTNQLDGGLAVWETAVELDAIQAYMLMLGGKKAPGVQLTLDDVIASEHNGTPPAVLEPISTTAGPPYALPYDPLNWNWHRISVRNNAPAGTPPSLVTSVPIWRQLKMK